MTKVQQFLMATHYRYVTKMTIILFWKVYEVFQKLDQIKGYSLYIVQSLTFLTWHIKNLTDKKYKELHFNGIAYD